MSPGKILANRVARAHNFYSCYNQANAYGCFLGHLERWISAVFQTDFVEAHNQRRLFGLVGWGGAWGGGWGGGVGGVPRLSRECAQAPLGSPGAGASRATHVRTREDGDVCQWPQVLASAGHCSSQQRLLAARLSAGGTARGQEAGLAGGGVAARLGETTRAGHTAPESRDADAVARARPPALAALAAAAHWQPGPAAAPPEGPGAGAQWPRAPPRGALRLDRHPTGRGPPAVGACGTSGQPLLPHAHHPILALRIDRRSSHTRGGRNIEVSWPFLVGFSATG